LRKTKEFKACKFFVYILLGKLSNGRLVMCGCSVLYDIELAASREKVCLMYESVAVNELLQQCSDEIALMFLFLLFQRNNSSKCK
jgi:hypothetical protein